MKATKDHKTSPIPLDIRDIFKANDNCPDHACFKLNYFCQDHDEVTCVQCVRHHHTQCDSIIPLDAAARKPHLLDIQCLDDELVRMDGVMGDLVAECSENDKYLETEHQRLKNRIKIRKRLILDKLEEIEKKTLQNLNEQLSEAKSKIEENKIFLQSKKQEVTELRETIKTAQSLHRSCTTFRAMKRLQKQSETYVKQLVSETRFTYNVQFTENLELESIIEKSLCFGTCTIDNAPSENTVKILHKLRKTEISDISLVLKRTIVINNEGDATPCIENCKILSNGEILILDSSGNRRVYISSITEDKHRSFDISKSDYHPCDIEAIDEQRCVVSYFGLNSVSVFDIDSGRHIQDEELSGPCYMYGLSYHNHELYITCEDKDIYVLSTKTFSIKRKIPLGLGDHNVYRFVVTGRNIFRRLGSEKSIYCSDMDNDLIWTFKDDSFENIKGLAVDNRNFVYVTIDSMGLYVIDPSGKNCRLLLDKKDGATNTVAVYYDQDTGQLLVCLDGHKTVALYDITTG